jgi:hypothetical protein
MLKWELGYCLGKLWDGSWYRNCDLVEDFGWRCAEWGRRKPSGGWKVWGWGVGGTCMHARRTEGGG